MFFRGSTDRWFWSEDVNPAVSFCIHALVVDGLHAPPFVKHLGGDGSLRDRGLGEPEWREWVAAVVTGLEALSKAGTAAAEGRLDDARRLAGQASWVLRDPGQACPGSDDLHGRLAQLWRDYQPAADRWKRRMTLVGTGSPRDQPRIGTDGDQKRRWKALEPFHRRISTLTVYVVDYGTPLVLAVPPVTALIAPAGDAGAYTAQLIEAAQELTRASGT